MDQPSGSDANSDEPVFVETQRLTLFIRLLTANEAHLSAFAMSLVPNWADADDLRQQTNLILWKKFDQYQVGTNFFSWASRIMYLEALSSRRRQVRSKLRFSDEFLATVAAEAERDAGGMSEREQALVECVKKLPRSQRELLRLRYEEAYDLEGISARLHRSIKTIYNSLSAIRKALLDCVERQVRSEA